MPGHQLPFAKVLSRIFPLTVLALWAAACSHGSQVPSDVANVTTCSVPSATVASWFKSGSVTLDGEVTPADSINFTNHPNCDFHVWSERMFLWLTSPTPPSYGGGGGRIFASPAFFDVSPEGPGQVRTLIAHKVGLPMNLTLREAQKGPHELPIVQDRRNGRLFELAPTPISERKLQMIRNTAGELVEIQRAEFNGDRPPTLFDPQGRKIDFLRPRDRNLKPREIVQIQKFTFNGKIVLFSLFGDFLQAEQAEADLGVLMAQNNSLVYYTIEVNDVYGYFASGVNSGAITATHFPLSASDEAPILAYAATKGVASFPDAEALAIELKTSWVEAVNLPSGCNYITMKAEIPDYDTSNSSVWPQTGTRIATLAMVGMHVVGSTKVHPEMIWATFEHICNAPTTSYTYNGSSLGQSGPGETGPWLLSSTDTPVTPVVSRMFYNNMVNPHQIEANSGDTIGPTDVQRLMPWGLPGTSSTGSNTEVIAVNHSVLSQLASGDLRANYVMTGSTWQPNGNMNFPAVGTNQLAATSMETFAQPSNCFDCHDGTINPLGDSSGNGLSHIFGEIQPLP
ncbi:MAG TPA: hypothetical protein VH394_19395 [Thermoanaerobaculia bacterium]|jgi:hypothetical protein|nr:hypothetical protein [Thermoanaerobaculia bacterium]